MTITANQNKHGCLVYQPCSTQSINLNNLFFSSSSKGDEHKPLKNFKRSFSYENKYHYTYPNTYIALYFSYAKATCNTHKNKKLLSIPLKLVPSLAKLSLPYFPLPLGGAPPHTQTSHSGQYTHIVGQEGGKHICVRVSIMIFIFI